MKLHAALLFPLLCGGLTACSWDHMAPLDCSSDPVKYTTTIKPIIEASCADSSFGNCHWPGANQPNWTDYAILKGAVDAGKIRERVLNTRTMPPSYTLGPAALDPCQLAQIQVWIDNGAPNN